MTRTAIILCGGKGSRLGSIGKKLPKTLIKFILCLYCGLY